MLPTSLLCLPPSPELQQMQFFRQHSGEEDEEKGDVQLCACTHKGASPRSVSKWCMSKAVGV